MPVARVTRTVILLQPTTARCVICRMLLTIAHRSSSETVKPSSSRKSATRDPCSTLSSGTTRVSPSDDVPPCNGNSVKHASNTTECNRSKPGSVVQDPLRSSSDSALAGAFPAVSGRLVAGSWLLGPPASEASSPPATAGSRSRVDLLAPADRRVVCVVCVLLGDAAGACAAAGPAAGAAVSVGFAPPPPPLARAARRVERRSVCGDGGDAAAAAAPRPLSASSPPLPGISPTS